MFSIIELFIERYAESELKFWAPEQNEDIKRSG
jgi:hypothetical protein